MKPLLSFLVDRIFVLTSAVAMWLFSFKAGVVLESRSYKAPAIGPGAARGWELPCRWCRVEPEPQV